jgi:hypothetical protein
MQLSIPETIIQSIRLPENRIEAELLKELANRREAQYRFAKGGLFTLQAIEHQMR